MKTFDPEGGRLEPAVKEAARLALALATHLHTYQLEHEVFCGVGILTPAEIGARVKARHLD